MNLVIVDATKEHAFLVMFDQGVPIETREIRNLSFDQDGWTVQCFGYAGKKLNNFRMIFLGDLMFNE